MQRWEPRTDNTFGALPAFPHCDRVPCTGGNESGLEHIGASQRRRFDAFRGERAQPPRLLAVAGCGGPAGPQVIDDPDGERGRGLLLVRGLSARTGWTGDRRGRLMWAQIPWTDQGPATPDPAHDPDQPNGDGSRRSGSFPAVWRRDGAPGTRRTTTRRPPGTCACPAGPIPPGGWMRLVLDAEAPVAGRCRVARPTWPAGRWSSRSGR